MVGTVRGFSPCVLKMLKDLAGHLHWDKHYLLPPVHSLRLTGFDHLTSDEMILARELTLASS